MNRAYSLLDVKDITERKDDYLIKGIATTPTSDRMSDVVESLGGTYALPIPMLWQHQPDKPIGRVISAKATKTGISVEISVPKVEEAGNLKERIDEAIQSIRYRLVTGLSIGFRALKDGVELMKDGGLRFTAWEWLELSLVTIPANADASITSIKSIDTTIRAATGIKDGDDLHTPPGATGKSHKPVSLLPKEGKTVNYKEQIAAFEAKLAANKARLVEIQEKSAGAGRSKDASEKEEFATLKTEIDTIEEELKDLRDLDAMNLKTVAPVVAATPEEAAKSRLPAAQRAIVEVRNPDLIKGLGFVRYVSALAQAKGNRFEAAHIADRWKDSTPEIAAILRTPHDVIEKTAVNPGTTTDTTWAAPLVQYQNLAGEFINYLRPLTIIGRIDGFRRVPFKVKVPRQTGGASVGWVGENKVKPLSSLAFDSITMDFSKVAGIIPLSEELVRLSSPSAEVLVRDDLAAAIAQFIDAQFLDPTKAADDVSPASVTYGVSATAPTGTTASALRADVKTMFNTLLTANQQVSSGVWIMTQGQALSLSLMQNSLGQAVHPGITATGGTFLGYPVIVSQNIAAAGGSPTDGYPIIFIMPNEILLADDGGVSIDVSREASLQMETAPDSPATASTVMVNLWQNNLIAIKAERFINWKVRRSTAVGLIQGARYAE
jgi:HK97 family phage major capsid protein/HK97 family phage prohead protease